MNKIKDIKTIQKELRLAHYNILNGGTTRLNKISQVISKINPDICGILEAVGNKEDIQRLQKMGKKLGYKFFLAKANSKYNIAVLSKISISTKVIRGGFRHVVLKVIVKEGIYKSLEIFFIHLSPISEDDRLVEIKNLSKYIKNKKNVIIMGDFNSLSPHDPYNRKNLLALFKKNNISKYGKNELQFKVIKKIESLHFTDAMRYLKKTFDSTTPTASNQDKFHAFPIRIDYCFLGEKILPFLKAAAILKNKNTENASDHYPLYINLSR